MCIIIKKYSEFNHRKQNPKKRGLALEKPDKRYYN